MKKIFLTLCVLFLNIFIVQNSYAQTDLSTLDPWVIEQFHSDITINDDSSLVVKERIDVDFYEERRGIFRDIPIHYEDAYGQPYNLRFTLLSVTDVAGVSHPYTEIYNWPHIRIRIGDPNVFLTGKQQYNITYSVKRAYTRQQTPSGNVLEFPWNVTGSWSEADMLKVGATLHLPDSVNTDDVQLTCFTGYSGSTKKDCSIERGLHSATFSLPNKLPKGEQLTTSIQIPLSQIAGVSQAQEVLWFIEDNYMMVFGGLMILLITILWFRYGRDYPIGSILTSWKVPPTLTPMLAKILTHEVVSSKDLPASLMYLATRGYIVITKGKSSYGFERTIKDDSDLPPPEKRLLEKLFNGKKSTTTDNLKNTFYKEINPIIGLASKESMERKWFYKDPGDVRALYLFVGIVTALIATFTSLVLDQGFGFITCLLAGIIWFIFSLYMPKMTRTGKKMHAQVLGLKEYIKRAESLRLRVKNPAGHTQKAFDELLPFAMIFGLEKEWAKQFEDVLSKPSDWLKSETGDLPFTASHFTSFIHAFSKSSTTALVSAPVTYNSSSSSSSSYSSSGGSSFSSGGSSGGGFGGGGGGSW